MPAETMEISKRIGLVVCKVHADALVWGQLRMGVVGSYAKTILCDRSSIFI